MVALHFKEEREITPVLPRWKRSVTFSNHIFAGCRFEKVFY